MGGAKIRLSPKIGLSHPQLKIGLTIVSLAVSMGWLQADFKQGQIPEFILGTGQWNARQLFKAEGVAVAPITGKVFFSDATTHRVVRFPASVSTSSLAINPAEAEAVLGPCFRSCGKSLRCR